jgi:hypothetical protein
VTNTPTFNGTGRPGSHDVPRDSYGRYLIPSYLWDAPLREKRASGEKLLPWTRVSTIAKTVQDKYGIGLWQMRMTVKGITLRPDLYALAAATSIEDKTTLDDVSRQALDAAAAKSSANIGTALHAFTDAVDRGENPVIPSPWDKDIVAYLRALTEYGIEILPELQEHRVVNPSYADSTSHGVAGTFDRIVMYQGRPVIADLKTGSDPLKYGASEIAVQLALYASAWAMWDGAYFSPMPEDLDQSVALVIHLPAGKGECTVSEIELGPAQEGIELAMRVRSYRRAIVVHRPAVRYVAEDVAAATVTRMSKKSVSPAAPTKAAAAPKRRNWVAEIEAAAGASDLRTIREQAKTAGAWTPDLLEAGLNRLKELRTA